MSYCIGEEDGRGQAGCDVVADGGSTTSLAIGNLNGDRVADVVQGDAKLPQALIRDKRVENLWLLPASQTRDKDALTEDGVARVIATLREKFDWVICDSPAGIEKGAHLAMYFADHAVVVVNPEVSSVRDSDRILGLLASKTRRAERGEGPVTQHLLLTRYNPTRVAIGEMLSVKDVEEILGIEVVGVIPESENVLTASNNGIPVIVDVDRQTWCMSRDAVKRACTAATKAIIPVHLYGQTADMDPILEAARDHDAVIIEDAAQAHGAEYHGKKAGRLGDSACFSFYATKNMTTGEGGMIVTDRDEVAEKARLFRDHGQAAKYEHVVVGFNLRMTEIAAAIGLVQLRKLDGWVRRRRENAAALTKGLEGIEGLVPPSEGNWMVHAYYQYILRAEPPFHRSRDELVAALVEDGIGPRPHHPIPPFKHTGLQRLRLPRLGAHAAEYAPCPFARPVHTPLPPAQLRPSWIAACGSCRRS